LICQASQESFQKEGEKLVNTKNVNLIAVPLLLSIFVSLANAQASRTWVSGVGDDANPCSRTAPCKTFAGAISKTAVGGEIDALDPGGFGAVTITKAITLDGGGGQVASILTNGTNAIVVTGTAATAVVTIRNLRFMGLGTSLSAIQSNSGVLHVENCDISGFHIGVETTAGGNQSRVTVVNTTITEATTAGISLSNSAGLFAEIRNTRVFNSAVGLLAADGTFAILRDSTFSHDYQVGVKTTATSRTSKLTVVTSSFEADGSALQTSSVGSIVSSGNFFADNSIVFDENGGQIFTGGDNVNVDNGSPGTTHGPSPKI
jgi:hypothetical protein